MLYAPISGIPSTKVTRETLSRVVPSSRSLSAGSWCPGPIAYLGRILEVLPRVGGGSCDRRLALGNQCRGTIPGSQARGGPGAPERLRGQVVAAHAVEDDHVERGRRGALLVETPNVKAVDVHVTVDDLVDGPLVAMKGEDDRLVCREELDEARLVHPVRVELAGEERHQVNDVDHADLEVRGVLAQPVGGGHGLQGRDVAGATQHDVRLAAPVVAGPLPRAGSRGGMLYRRVHVEPLQLGLLVYSDQVDVVAAPEAVVGAG